MAGGVKYWQIRETPGPPAGDTTAARVNPYPIYVSPNADEWQWFPTKSRHDTESLLIPTVSL